MPSPNPKSEARLTPVSRKKRRPHRRDEILTSAVRLFHEKGYHSTGIDDIGAAAGITGPAVYRHFKSKEEILETLLVGNAEEWLANARDAVENARTPLEGLRRLSELHVEFVIENPSLSFVVLYERRTLQGKMRGNLDRIERQSVEEWVHALMQVRPELADGEARVIIRAVSAMAVSAVTYRSGLDRAVLKELVTEMVMQALLAGQSTARRPRAARRAG